MESASNDRGAQKEKANLPDDVELAVGMEVMVTYNVETKLYVANKARGVVQEIYADRREQILDALTESPREATLTYPPECVFVKLNRTKAYTLPGLEPGVMPIIPMERGYDICSRDGIHKRV
ncbi:hypothetical protein FRC09_011978 [Ceratobasidium sp. 395]|nr:hypothetical protein FRC09_011978 [Ceratobasidium sp. 395]